MISAFAEIHLLQVLFFAVLLGLALATMGERGPPIIFRVIEQTSHAFFRFFAGINLWSSCATSRARCSSPWAPPPPRWHSSESWSS